MTCSRAPFKSEIETFEAVLRGEDMLWATRTPLGGALNQPQSEAKVLT